MSSVLAGGRECRGATTATQCEQYEDVHNHMTHRDHSCLRVMPGGGESDKMTIFCTNTHSERSRDRERVSYTDTMALTDTQTLTHSDTHTLSLLYSVGKSCRVTHVALRVFASWQ